MMLRYLALTIMQVGLTPSGAHTQSQPRQSPGTGMVSGRITNGVEPLVGLRIALQPVGTDGPPSSHSAVLRSRTDADGRYQFSGVTAGQFEFVVFSPIYVQPGDPRSSRSGRRITLGDGENATNIDLALVRGGIVTGKITRHDGRPMIEQTLYFDWLDEQNKPSIVVVFIGGALQTDDRGIYRTSGITPGRYRVSAGGDNSNHRRASPRTYHPDVVDDKQARIIEVREGQEITGIDIKLAPPVEGYTLSGRTVDDDTGQPIANLAILCYRRPADGLMSPVGGKHSSDIKGEFRIDNLSNGPYALFARGDAVVGSSPSSYSEMVPVEVQNNDVSGIDIRVKRGGSISGVVVLEGTTDSAKLAQLRQHRIFAFSNDGTRAMRSSPPPLEIGPDGRFRLDGLQPGKVILLHRGSSEGAQGITFVRIERDGVAQPDGITIGQGEQVTGIRIVFAYGTGAIRGMVTVAGGELPQGTKIMITRRLVEGLWGAMNPTATPDPRGYFTFEGLSPGIYELEARIGFNGPPPPDGRLRSLSVKQKVEVANGQTAQVTMTLDLSVKTPNSDRSSNTSASSSQKF